MILGNICTRSCKFCGVKTGKPLPVDWEEAEKVANSIRIMQIKHAVLTSVDRDDLRDDMGSKFWVETIKKIRELNPASALEGSLPCTPYPKFTIIGKLLEKTTSRQIHGDSSC